MQVDLSTEADLLVEERCSRQSLVTLYNDQTDDLIGLIKLEMTERMPPSYAPYQDCEGCNGGGGCPRFGPVGGGGAFLFVIQ